MFGTRENQKETGTSASTTISAPRERSSSRQTSSDTITAYLGPDTEVEGTLRFEHSVLIEGKFKGSIHSGGSLVIGEGAEIEAEITSGIVAIKGNVKGSIVASERVQIQGHGIVMGDITTPSLQMDESVTFEGRCSMGGNRGKKKEHHKAEESKDKILEAVDSVKS